jgi:hypothetical protein
MTITNKDLFYCYDLDLYQYLKHEKKINPLTIATSIKTNRIFSLFARCEYLTNSIDEYESLT